MMKKKIFTIITYLLIFFNSNLFSNENNNVLKIGLLAPLAGEYEELGKSLLYSLNTLKKFFLNILNLNFLTMNPWHKTSLRKYF